MPETFDSPSRLPAGLAEPAFDPNAMRVLKERYFAKKADGTVETPQEFVWRVASSIAKSEAPHAIKLGRDPEAVVDGVSHAFYDMMVKRDFMPNTPCLVNAGRPLSMLSACFVLPVPDSIEGIFYNLKAMALVQKAGGGTGFAFSSLRQQGAGVESTGKDASGPVSFMKVFNAATDSIKQGGVRRGANMGVLKVDHPDIFEFMKCKKELDAENRALWNRLSDTGRYSPDELAHLKQELLQTQINNFNISIGVTDAFMAAVKADGDFDLHDPRTHETVRTVRAREIWDAIVEGAWQNGEPGVLFLDHPDVNPLPGLGPIEATNPCVTADTWVMTTDGAQQVKTLIGKPFTAVVNGKPYHSSDRGFFFTGIKKTIDLKTDRGFSLRATPNHEILVRNGKDSVWKELGELSTGDEVVLHDHEGASWGEPGSRDAGWLLGTLLGDGHFNFFGNARLEFWGESAPQMAERASDILRENFGRRHSSNGTAVKERDLLVLNSKPLADFARSMQMSPDHKVVTPAIEAGGSEFICGFLQGWFDADGSVQGTLEKGVSVRLASSYLPNLEAAQRMLARLGIISTIYVNRRDAGVREMPNGKGGTALYECAAQHELQIANTAIDVFRDRIGFSQPAKQARLENLRVDQKRATNATKYWATITSLIEAEECPVYDCEIPGINAFDANGIYVHNCGEQFLHGYDSCNLGSINVGHFYDARAKDVDWERLAQTTTLAIRFLDNVIDANLYPIDEIREMVTNNRRVGLGVMGFADLLIQMQIAYGSPQAVAFAAKLMSFIQERAQDASEVLARERGDFPNKHLSIWADDPRPRRNAALLSVAPTGTISMIAGCSFGCEPYFGMAYTKHVMKDSEGRPQHLYYVVPLFEEIAKDEGFYSEDLLAAIEENRGSVKGLPGVPKLWQEVFTTSADVTVDEHIDMLAAFQKYTDNAVSKTINAPNDDTRENVSRAIFRAYEVGCKGFTYYRDGSRTEQVVTFSKDNDLAGGNRDVAATATPAAPVASAPAAVGTDTRTSVDIEIDALLARANALLEVK
jgi:ribonucleoside-diphosphate reductase alpha chain